MEEKKKKPNKHELQSLMIGIASFLICMLSSLDYRFYKDLFYEPVSPIYLLIVWWGMFVLIPQLKKTQFNSFAGSFVMTLIFGISMIVVETYKSRDWFSNLLVLICSIILGILMWIYSSRELQAQDSFKLEKIDNKIDARIISNYRFIAFLLSMALMVITFLFIYGGTIFYSSDDTYLAIAGISLIIFPIFMFIFLKLDFHFMQAVKFLLMVEIELFGFYSILGLAVPEIHNSHNWNDPNLLFFFQNPFLLGSILFILVILSFNFGLSFDELPYYIIHDRYQKRQYYKAKRRHQRELRLLKHSPGNFSQYFDSRQGISNSGDSTLHISPNINDYNHRDPYQSYPSKESSTNQREAPVSTRKFTRSHTVRGVFSTLFSKNFTEVNNIGNLNISWSNKLHIILNGSWMGRKFPNITFSLIYLWISMFSLNSVFFQYSYGLAIISGVITFTAMIFLLILPDDGNIKSFATDSENFMRGLFLGIMGINGLVSILFPNLVFFLLIPEIFLLAPYLGAKWKDFQSKASTRDSSTFNILQISILLLWISFTTSMLVNPTQYGLHIIIFLVWNAVVILFLGFTLGWKKMVIPICLQIFLSAGLSISATFLGLTLTNGSEFWITSCILSILFILFSGIVFQLLYFRIKILAQDSFPEISEELKNQMEQISNLHMETESNVEMDKTIMLENLTSYYQTHEELVPVMCPICHEEFSLGEEELNVLRKQYFIYCPNCQERVTINEILEPSYNSLILEHRKVIQDVEKKLNGDHHSTETPISNPSSLPDR